MSNICTYVEVLLFKYSICKRGKLTSVIFPSSTDRVGRQELEIVIGDEHISFTTSKIGSLVSHELVLQITSSETSCLRHDFELLYIPALKMAFLPDTYQLSNSFHLLVLGLSLKHRLKGHQGLQSRVKTFFTYRRIVVSNFKS